jgi:hypothetical protein
VYRKTSDRNLDADGAIRRVGFLLFTFSVADPYHVDADPDPVFRYNTDPDPETVRHFDADPDPDPTLHFNCGSRSYLSL